jgi:hypothetical protein
MNESDQMTNIAKYRSLMKRKLRILNFPVNDDDTTERLEAFIKYIDRK